MFILFPYEDYVDYSGNGYKVKKGEEVLLYDKRKVFCLIYRFGFAECVCRAGGQRLIERPKETLSSPWQLERITPTNGLNCW